MSSIKGPEALKRKINAINGASVPSLIHRAMLAQLEAQAAQIPVDTGRLKDTLLDGAGDVVRPGRVTIDAVPYAKFNKIPEIDGRQLAEDVARQLFTAAGFRGF